MTETVCTQCGETLEADATECAFCGEKREERKRGEDSGVRVEQRRLQEALRSQEPPVAKGSWGKVDASAAGAAAVRTDRTTVPPEVVPLDIEEPLPAGTRGGSGTVALPRKTAHASEGRSPTPTQPIIAPRPRVLASEALQRDLAPATPAPRALGLAALSLGLLGAANTWLLTRGQHVGVPLGAAFLGLALLGLPSMPYVARAAAVATVSATGLSLVLWADANGPSSMAQASLLAAITALTTGLFLRSFHRASGLARALVTSGILLSAVWLFHFGDFSRLSRIDTGMHVWLPRWLDFALVLTLMLSLLSFMDARTTAFASGWATLALLWYVAKAVGELVQLAIPEGVQQLDLTRLYTNAALSWASSPLLCALLSLGLAQLLAASLAAKATQPKADAHEEPPRDQRPR